MNPRQPTIPAGFQRRPKKLSERLAHEKIERAGRMTPEERLAVALHLSDFCRDPSRADSSKSRVNLVRPGYVVSFQSRQKDRKVFVYPSS
jgi:hypothetical protein